MRQRKSTGAGSDPASNAIKKSAQDDGNETASSAAAGTTDLPRLLLLLLLVARVTGATMTMITDCDETFNYWEPVHYVLFGWGYQVSSSCSLWQVSRFQA